MAEIILSTIELRNLSDKELQKELAKSRHNLAATRIAIRTGKEKTISKAKDLKAYIARIHTIQGEFVTKSAKKENK